MKWTIQVQAQFEVEAETLEDARDQAVAIAMNMESTEWATIELPEGWADAAAK